MEPLDLREAPETPAALAERLALNFSNSGLLARALTHRSYINEHADATQDNERLEFLGDAVLDFVVGAWLYNRCPEMAEGELTRLRSALVRTEQLAEFARTLDLGRAMRLGRGEDAAGGRDRPALLCATFEALIGAIYLNGGIPEVEAFVLAHFEKARLRLLAKRAEIHDAKSRLQEWAQSRKLGTPHYTTLEAAGPDHAKWFEVEVRIDERVYGRGAGTSKQVAAQLAARAALDAIEHS